MGSHEIPVIHFECALYVNLDTPVDGSHIMSVPDLSPEAKWVPQGDQLTVNTWFLCPVHVNLGRAVLVSQNLTVVSPPPDAR